MRNVSVFAFTLLAAVVPAAAQSSVTVTNAATFLDRFGVAPGGLASLFGTLTGFSSSVAASLPWPKDLSGVRVLVNGEQAPLYAVFPSTAERPAGQINFQVPSGVGAGGATVVVTLNGMEIARGAMSTAAASPGIFLSDFSSRQGAILNQDYSLNSSTARARRGDVIQVFGTGQGPLQSAVNDGDPAVPYAVSAQTPKVYIANVEAAVQFSGVVGYPGLWQINVVVPDRPFVTGPTPLVMVQNGVQSNQATFWVVD